MQPIPVTILTGFLGSGKTTLLNRLLGDPQLADTAVIINEFGDVSIDHLLVESISDGIIQLADGCLCCTVRGELVDTIADLIDRLQSGKIERLKRIIIETTGLADPGPVVGAITAHPVFLHILRFDGVVTTVDAVHGAATLDRHAEAAKQVAIADRIVLTKADIADEATVAALKARLVALNPRVQIVDAAEAGYASLFESGLYNHETGAADTTRWLDGGHNHDSHDHDHHDHHHSHHDSRIATYSLTHDAAVPFAAIETFVDLLRSLHGERLLRMKGVIEIVEDPEHPLVIHGVQTVFHPPGRLKAWPEGPRGVRIVLITFDMPKDYVTRLFRAVTATPSIDEPDRAALADNPLAVAGFSAR